MNKQIFLLINNLTNISIVPKLLQILSNIFFIGNFAIGYIIICIYFYIKLKQQQKQQSPNQQKEFQQYFLKIYHNIVLVGNCYALFGISYTILKFSINFKRPFCSLPEAEFITIIDITTQRCLSSFPSAHTGLSIMVMYFLWPYLKPIFKPFAILIIILVSISRITLAMHYPADILYSIPIVAVIITINNHLFNLFKDKIITPVGNFIFSKF
ncbi:MAG: phosphatase PAP2 family protein [Rickettsiaceae bacterium]|nr:phosphatase PAP2 family protein [Rickettsiaceae bacterium]